MFKDCTITHTGSDLLYLYGKPNVDSQIMFENCIVNKSGGKLLSGYNMQGSLDVIRLNPGFNNTAIDRNLAVDTINEEMVKISYDD
ncbi:MAG: hypothetical protein K6E10_10305 [Eubacterium sp.]|nr:hypothetical protein [Eubacterium sp.]